MRERQEVGQEPPPGSSNAAGAFVTLTVVGLIVALPGPGLAYVGPGAGIAMLGALWAVIAAIVLALGGLLLWPIRTMLRRRRRASSPKPTTAARGDSGAS